MRFRIPRFKTETSVLKRGRLTYWMSYEKTEVVQENDNRKENDKTKQQHYLCGVPAGPYGTPHGSFPL